MFYMDVLLDLQKTGMGFFQRYIRFYPTGRLFAALACAAVWIFLAPACSEGEPESANAAAAKSRVLTEVQWLDSSKNFGRITEGQKLSVSFRFRNSGPAPLVIESVKPSCGCTVADYPKQPIPPGGEGEITGEFDSNGREGLQQKEITVMSNTPGGQHQLQFQVNVVKNPSQGAAASN